MKNLLPLIFLSFISNSHAQSTFIKNQIDKKFILQKGYELDYSLFPFNSVQLENEIYYNQWESAGINLSYVFRINLLEIDADQAISISTVPTLGLSFGVNKGASEFAFNSNLIFNRDVIGIGNLNFPIEFNYHIGKGATKNSTFKYGLNFSFGREWRLNPLISWADLPEYKIGLEKYNSGYIIKLGFVREKKKVHEIYFRTLIFDRRSEFFTTDRNPFRSSNFSIGLRTSRK